MDIDFTRKFNGKLNRLAPKSRQKFYERLQLFSDNPRNQLLRLHALKGKYHGYYSIDISGDLRALFKYQSQDSVIFVFIGTHSQLY